MPASWLANPMTTRKVLERFGVYTKHRLGQNFLVDDTVIAKILELAHLTEKDCILEVGPGIGTLSVALLSRVHSLIAIEADSSLGDILDYTCEPFSEKLTLLWGDALKLLPSCLDEYCPSALVANLPYQIAATLILLVLKELPCIKHLVVMVQSEVADRICAQPATKTYGAYTAKLGLYGFVSDRFEVLPSSFMPSPHVMSSVIRIVRHGFKEQFPALSSIEKQGISELIDAAFSQRRKTIKNCLVSKGYDVHAVENACISLGFDPKSRAEVWTTKDFIELYKVLL